MLAPVADRTEVLGRKHGAGRIGRRGEDQAVDRPFERFQRCHGRLIVGVRSGHNLDRFQIERRENVAVAGVARRRQRNPVTGVKGGEKGQREAA